MKVLKSYKDCVLCRGTGSWTYYDQFLQEDVEYPCHKCERLYADELYREKKNKVNP